MLGEAGDEGTGHGPAERGDVVAVLRLHGISGSVAAELCRSAVDLRRRTRRRGIEHAITLDIHDGRPIGPNLTGNASSTDLTPHLLALQRERDYVQLHTHPNSPSFSALDVRVLADHTAVRSMIAVGVDGTWYVMSRTPETRFSDRHALYDAYLGELIRLEELGIEISERSHLVMEHVAGRYGLRYDRVTGSKDEQTTS